MGKQAPNKSQVIMLCVLYYRIAIKVLFYPLSIALP